MNKFNIELKGLLKWIIINLLILYDNNIIIIKKSFNSVVLINIICFKSGRFYFTVFIYN